MTVVENILTEYNKSGPPTSTDDLKVGNIFESKVNFLQEISEYSFVLLVSFKPAKTNRTHYTIVCDADDGDGGRVLVKISCLNPKKIRWILQN